MQLLTKYEWGSLLVCAFIPLNLPQLLLYLISGLGEESQRSCLESLGETTFLGQKIQGSAWQGMVIGHGREETCRNGLWGGLQTGYFQFALVWPCGWSWPMSCWLKLKIEWKCEGSFSPPQQLTKKVNNIETGWALGATFHLLQSLGVSHWGQKLPPRPAFANNLLTGEDKTQSCYEAVWKPPGLKPSSWLHQEEEVFVDSSCP